MRSLLIALGCAVIGSNAVAWADGRGFIYSDNPSNTNVAGQAYFDPFIGGVRYGDFALTISLDSDCIGDASDEFSDSDEPNPGGSTDMGDCIYITEMDGSGEVSQDYSLTLGTLEIQFDASTSGNFAASWSHECVDDGEHDPPPCCNEGCSKCTYDIGGSLGLISTGGGTDTAVIISVKNFHVNSAGILRIEQLQLTSTCTSALDHSMNCNEDEPGDPTPCPKPSISVRLAGGDPFFEVTSVNTLQECDDSFTANGLPIEIAVTACSLLDLEISYDGGSCSAAAGDGWDCPHSSSSSSEISTQAQVRITFEPDCLDNSALSIRDLSLCPGKETDATVAGLCCEFEDCERAPGIIWTFKALDDGVVVEFADIENEPCKKTVIASKTSKSGRAIIRATIGDCPPFEQEISIGCGSCANGDCGAGGGQPKLGSVDLSISLGRGADGKSAGSLLLHGEEPSAELATPDALLLSAVQQWVFRHPLTGTPSQVKAPEVLVTIAATTATAFEIKIYEPDDVTDWGDDIGPWTISGGAVPLRKWEIVNPNSLPDVSQLRVRYYARSSNALGLVASYLYDYNETSATHWEWTLASGPSDSTVVRSELSEWEWNSGLSAWDVSETVTQDGGTYSSVTETRKDFPWGSGILSRTISTGSGTLVSTCEYYPSTAGGAAYKLWKESNPDGSWVAYTYNDNGLPTAIIRSYRDATLPSSPAIGDGASTEYVYWPSGGDRDAADDNAEFMPERPRVTIERVGNTIVAKSYDAYFMSGSNLVHIHKRATDLSSNTYSTGSNLVTTTTYEGTNEEHPRDVIHENNTWDNYDYQYESEYQLIIVKHGYKNGSGAYADLEGKSTQEITTLDLAGRRTELETYAFIDNSYSGNMFQEIFWEYDDLGRMSQENRSNGTQSNTTWLDCCGSRTTSGFDGTTVTTDMDAVLHRLTTSTRDAAGSQPALTTAVEYDVVSGQRVETTTISGGGDSLETTRIYDLAGRLVEAIDEAGLSTTYEYDDSWSGDGRKVTITHPGGATEITEYYRDGRPKKVWGTAITGDNPPSGFGRHYDYGANSNGSTWSKTATGTSISAARYSTTTFDVVGRVYTEERPAYSSGSVSTTNYYNGLGQLYKTTTTGQNATLRDYDSMGSLLRTALDVTTTPTDTITLNSMDRITESETVYDNDGGIWRITTTKTYPTANNQTPKTLSTQRERLTGYGGFSGSSPVVTREVRTKDVLDVESIAVTEITRDDALVRIEVNSPNSDIDAETVSILGLVQSTTSKTGATVSYEYDGLGRRTLSAGPRAGVWTQTNYESDTNRVASIMTNNEDNTGSITAATYEYYDTGANLGRVKSIENAGENVTYFSYTARGETEKTWGDVPQPTWVEYDAFGQRIALHTYRNTGLNFATSTWPSGSGDGDETNWSYHEATGLLTSKTYADATSVGYTYTSEGRLYTRTWARNSGGSGVTTYDYVDETGELEDIDYPSGTTDIAFSYLRTGQLNTVTDESGQRTFTYHSADLQLKEEKLPSFFSSKWITHNYETNVIGKLNRLRIGTSSSPGADYDVSYEYADTVSSQSTGRMSRVSNASSGIAGLPTSGTTPGIMYRYASGSDQVEYTVLRNSSANKFYARRSLETYRELLDKIGNYYGDVDNQSGATEISTYDYTNDSLGRRTSCNVTTYVPTPPAQPLFTPYNQQYDYNDRNELTYSKRPVSSPTKQWTYAYDPIGNRTQYVENLGSAKTTDYQSNAVNQYPSSELTSPHTSQGYRYDDDGNLTEMFIAGDMDCSGQVNNLDTTAMNLAVSNPSAYATAYPGCNILNGDFDGDGDVDSADQTLLAAVLSDGTANATFMNYTWDAENRLIKVEPPNPSGTGIFLKTEFKYDYMGRRIEKKVWTWQQVGGTWQWVVTTQTKYVWDGWLLLEELNALSSNAVTKKYTWGLDLSGLNGSVNDRTSAGGIGGLLAMRIISGSKDYCYFYDGNGNVGQVVEWSQSSSYVKAKYEYDPYGNRVNTGSGEPANDFRFSTKMLDSETGLYYYGYRYYSPRLGRWITRDPVDISPTDNAYRAMKNAPLFYIDPRGDSDVPSIGVQDDSLCYDLCIRSGHCPGTDKFTACKLGCLNGSNDAGQGCSRFCSSWTDPAARGACNAACQAHLPNLGAHGAPCDSTVRLIGHGTVIEGGESGWPTLDDGTAVTPTYIKQKVCPRICWGGKLVLWTCRTASNSSVIDSIAANCPKISRIEGCLGDIWEGKYVPWWWCCGGWKEVEVNKKPACPFSGSQE